VPEQPDAVARYLGLAQPYGGLGHFDATDGAGRDQIEIDWVHAARIIKAAVPPPTSQMFRSPRTAIMSIL
jgi:hypothetical protein